MWNGQCRLPSAEQLGSFHDPAELEEEERTHSTSLVSDHDHIWYLEKKASISLGVVVGFVVSWSRTTMSWSLEQHQPCCSPHNQIWSES